MLEALTLKSIGKEEPSEENNMSLCLQCNTSFKFPEEKDDLLAHLYLSHRLVVADVEDIANLEEYLKYWRQGFIGHELEEFCTTMLLDQLPDGTPAKNEKYYLLSDILPKDRNLRKKLHTERLEKVLSQHQFERTDRTFSRECLHCRDVIKGLRADFLEHLFNKHFLQLGRPENLVFIDELIDEVQIRLENLICLFCEKVFKDRATLKEHMRKKAHKRINPELKFFDKFFLINYKNEKVKHVKHIRKCKNKNSNNNTNASNVKDSNNEESNMQPSNSNLFNSDDSESDWSDWDGDSQVLTCLFCPIDDTDFQNLKLHMNTEHAVNLDKELCSLSFYQKIKVVNYIRRQMHINCCVTCNEKFDKSEELHQHLVDKNHCSIGNRKQWDQPEFFFPTYEDDGVLYCLDDSNETELEDIGVVIFSEDSNATINRDAETLSLEKFVI